MEQSEQTNRVVESEFVSSDETINHVIMNEMVVDEK